MFPFRVIVVGSTFARICDEPSSYFALSLRLVAMSIISALISPVSSKLVESRVADICDSSSM